MKVCELINQLTQLWRAHGDLEVGLRDCEFGNFTAVGIAIAVVANNHDAKAWKDDPELGDLFIGIDTPANDDWICFFHPDVEGDIRGVAGKII